MTVKHGGRSHAHHSRWPQPLGSFTGGGEPPTGGSFILLEDGSSKILLENGTDKLLLEV